MAKAWGQPRAQVSLTTRPSMSDPSAPPLVKAKWSKKYFISSAAQQQASATGKGGHDSMSRVLHIGLGLI